MGKEGRLLHTDKEIVAEVMGSEVTEVSRMTADGEEEEKRTVLNTLSLVEEV